MKPEIICIGMGTVDLLAKGVPQVELDGQTHQVESVGMKIGGDATNESITLHRLGHEVMLATAVGDDDSGSFYIAKCAEAGISTEGIIIDQEYPTATSVVLVGSDGERSFLAVPQNASSMMRFRLPGKMKLTEDLKAISIASLFYSHRQSDADLKELLIAAKKAGAIVFADMVMDLKELSLEDLRETLPHIDYLVPSYDEAVYYTGKNDPREIAETLHQYGVKNVVIKMGADGVYAHTENEECRVGTVAEKVVDTTGAGDNFMAGFICAIIRGMKLKEALQFGSATSAIAIGELGATGAVKSFDQVMDYLKTHS